MDRLTAGIVIVSQLVAFATYYGSGVPQAVWTLETVEAAVFARLLARRADRGSQQAREAIGNLMEAVDYMEAGIILGPRFVATVQHYVQQGFHPAIMAKEGK